jgi:biopolymer transport protein ExbD
MNLAKHDPETDMDMNMTPMIDVVFLLIIFFMVITDLTQQDLEDLELPMALSAKPDKPDPEQWRPIINIPHTGRMVVKREAYYDPERDDGLADPHARIKQWLVLAAGKMEKDHLNVESQTGPMIPDDPLLIRADQSTQFKHIQKVMEYCGLEGIQIWKIQLAASTPEPEK